MKRSRNWSKLDNAAKIFPPASSRRDTKVYRLVCELTEPVDAAVLQHAAERTALAFPMFSVILKKGLFWFFFEENDKLPVIMPEHEPLCMPIYDGDYLSPLYRILYYKCRINLEIFHALTDGTGALQYFRMLIFYYLSEKYGLSEASIDYDASGEQKRQDAFYQYYDKREPVPKAKSYRAYRIRGTRFPKYGIGVIEGTMSAKAVLEKAHEHGATMSEFLAALMLCAIYEDMPVRDREKPVVISVPVDLRRFFSAQTARNFFGIIRVAHSFEEGGTTLEQVLKGVHEAFLHELTEENLRGIIGRYSAIESHPLVRIIPLPIKTICLKLAALRAAREDTAAISNLGTISMPAGARRYIRLFSIYLGTKRPQLCLCSFEDTLTLAFSSPLTDTSLQRRFFRMLTEMGISVEITSNLGQLGGKESEYAKV